ncbi:MAG: glycosyltransferase family 2 protein, partial [Miltoncostaeaceae bacterium]
MGSVLVVDSESGDDTVRMAHRAGAEVLSIAAGDFNHGATRELARKRLGSDVVVMVSQDAYARSAADVA